MAGQSPSAVAMIDTFFPAILIVLGRATTLCPGFTCWVSSPGVSTCHSCPETFRTRMAPGSRSSSSATATGSSACPGSIRWRLVSTAPSRRTSTELLLFSSGGAAGGRGGGREGGGGGGGGGG